MNTPLIICSITQCEFVKLQKVFESISFGYFMLKNINFLVELEILSMEGFEYLFYIK